MKEHSKKTCGVCEIPHFERNHYYYEKLMTARDFIQEQSYHNEKRWLINRMILGWGVVCGLQVEYLPEKRSLLIYPGLALDCCGHELLVCETNEVPIRILGDPCHPPRMRGVAKLAVCLSYRECRVEPVHLRTEACEGKESSEFNRIRDSYSIRIVPLEEVCTDEGPVCCPLDHRQPGLAGKGLERCTTESLHHFLCRCVQEHDHDCSDDCVVLAVVTIVFSSPKEQVIQKREESQEHLEPTSTKQRREDSSKREEKAQEPPCDEPEPEDPRVEVDCCSARRIVYNNALLFQLIQCYHGDLPHIVEFSWRDFLGEEPHPTIDWSTFVRMVGEGLTFTYDRPLRPESLNSCSFLVRVQLVEAGTGHAVAKYLPGKVSYWEDPCPTARFEFDKDWKSDELTAKNSELRHGIKVEVVQRGSMIVDKQGKGLDGEYVGLRLPTGNGSRCGDFLLCFSVSPRSAGSKTKAQTYDV